MAERKWYSPPERGKAALSSPYESAPHSATTPPTIPLAIPAKAEAGTLRKEFAQSIERNATHGSDAPETAAFEIGYFFAGIDLV